MNKTRVKTKYKGLVWVHSRYIDAVKKGETLIIEHGGETMTVTHDTIKKCKPVRGKETYTERWGTDRGTKYRLYGFNFEPDQLHLL